MTRVLYALRHGLVRMDPGAPPAHWGLSPEGTAHSHGHALLPGVVCDDWWSSPEQKAVSTLDAALDGGAFAIDERLRELERTEWVENYRASAVRALSQRTHAAMPGWETAIAASSRLQSFIGDQVGTVGICTHGLVLTSWLTEHASTPFDPVGFWAELTFPDLWRITLGKGLVWVDLERVSR